MSLYMCFICAASMFDLPVLMVHVASPAGDRPSVYRASASTTPTRWPNAYICYFVGYIEYVNELNVHNFLGDLKQSYI